MIINHNVSALNAYRNLRVTSRSAFLMRSTSPTKLPAT